MSWNYRVVRYPSGEFGLHEVYYGEDGEPEGWTSRPISFVCDEEEGVDGISKSLAQALRDALCHPVLPIPDRDEIAGDRALMGRLLAAQRGRDVTPISRPDSQRIVALAQIGLEAIERGKDEAS